MMGNRLPVILLSTLVMLGFLPIAAGYAQGISSTTVSPTGSVSLDIRDGDLREVFLKLADQAKINLMVSPKVQGKVTFRVTDMDPVELIGFIARTNGLEIEKHGRILLIMADDSAPPSRVRFEVIPLQNAKAAEVEKIIQNLKLDKRTTVTHDARTNRLIVVYPD